jgi:predicted transcriptional regulator
MSTYQNTHRLNDNKDCKDKYFNAQMKIVLEYLKENTATASMVELDTGVPQKNICRYKRTLEKNGLLYELHKAQCKRTGFKAFYLTTNPEAFPKSNQLTLF